MKVLKRKLRRLGIVLSDSRWWPFYIQRRFMKLGLRDKLSAIVASVKQKAAAPDAKFIDALNKHSAQLKNTGISHLGAIFNHQQCDEIYAYFSNKLIIDDYRPETPAFLPKSHARHPLSHTAHHNASDILQAPYLFQLANDPRLMEIAAAFLGCKPTIGYLAAWWSYSTEIGAQQAENFHRDVDDWRFLKLFVYLTDVGENNGPHIYVSHSSDSDKLREIRRFDDTEVVTAFGKENILQLTGQAGEGFVENTFGIHKGQPVKQGTRLIFQVVYSMFPLPYGPKTPVMNLDALCNSTGVVADSWVNRVYLS
ncbi:MAG: hypothetical protein Q7R66_06755 [Undibacterium sp.]|uniref:hypothetical protein n=1 Tax=Undibacterium sp. TaxID=1914977 RepID=UPI0027191307|nr:hypothetical protein [Undibacterium sp.]MDO8651869.1 hypothetical protein [Undibacterium sp.]